MALALVGIGLVLLGALLIGQVDSPDRQYGTDLGAFHNAAIRISEGQAIYPPEMVAAPVDAQGEGIYRYPPPLAQLLVPVAGLGFQTVALGWLLMQSLAIFVALWVGTGIGGARRTLERGLWCGVAALYFLPAFDAVWKGNVSGFLALTTVAVALGGTAAGLGASVGALIKAVPGTLVPAAIAMDARARVVTIAVLVAAVAISFVAAPQAWLDYPQVVLNVMAGSTDYANNLAPANLLAQLGTPDVIVAIVRAGTIMVALAAIVGSVILARRRDGIRLAALLGAVALLLVPGSLWYHYFVVLLPFAAMAWPRATPGQRTALIVSALLVSLSLAWLPLSIIGATLMVVVSARVIRPRSADPVPA